MHKYSHLGLFTLGLTCLGLSGYVMSLFFPNLYFNFEKVTNFHYTQINGTDDCYVELTIPHESYNYTCTKTPCPYQFEENQSVRTEVCYLPPHQEMCPYETCLNRDLITTIWVSGLLSIMAVFFLFFTGFHLIVALRKFKEEIHNNYNFL